MNPTDNPTQLEPDPAADTAGDRLRNAREHLDLSLREVASDLNLMVSHVRGMETNRCAHLTDDAIFLRHMRSYAALVAIDAEEIIELYRSQSADSDAVIQTPPSKRLKALNRVDSKWYAVGVLAIACVGLGFWSLNQSSPATAKGSATELLSETTGNKPAAAAKAVSKDIVEVPAASKSKASAALNTINTVSEPPARASNENSKPAKQTSTQPAAETVARSDQPAPATAEKSSRTSSGNDAQYKNALRSLGTKPLRKTLIELTSDAAEQTKG